MVTMPASGRRLPPITRRTVRRRRPQIDLDPHCRRAVAPGAAQAGCRDSHHQRGRVHQPGRRTHVQRLRQPHGAQRRLLQVPQLRSDERLQLAQAMRLPLFQVAGLTLLKRLTMVIDAGVVSHIFYPVFPPGRSADDVLNWLRR